MSLINTEEEVFDIGELILSGGVDLDNLPIENYNAVGFSLWNQVQEIFGISLDDVDRNSDLFFTMSAYKENVFEFAAAKTFQMVKDAKQLVFDVNGIKKTIDVFAPQFKALEGVYNEAWLKTEIELTRKQSVAASLWNDIQDDKSLFPILRYQTVGDDRVRDDHALLDNVVRPVNDPFWKSFFPPNGWNCRCTVEQLPEDEADVTPISKHKSKLLAKEIESLSPLFNFNAGIEKKIFRGSHPYFAVGNKYQHLKRMNFRLKIPEINNLSVQDGKTLEF